MNYKPNKFAISIGGFIGPCYSLMLKDEVLLYQVYQAGYEVKAEERINPQEASWMQFRTAIDKLDLWSWQAEYADPGVLDGTYWSVEIEFADKMVKSEGSNCYPGEGGKPNEYEKGKSFKKFLGAVRKLIGGREFS